MNPNATGHAFSTANRPLHLKLTVAVLVAAGVLSTASVWAQQQPEVNVVTVSGVRAAALAGDAAAFAVAPPAAAVDRLAGRYRPS